MPIVKLDATSSTNDFLKEMAGNQSLENYTVVTAESQTNGRGQMGAKWHSESGKNLIVSVLIVNGVLAVSHIYDLNVSVSLAVCNTLKQINLPDLSIKWPNDIMSGNKKIGGILIENVIKGSGITSIVGIGLNVNQTNFSELPNASSIANILNKEIDRDNLLNKLLEEIKQKIQRVGNGGKDVLWTAYKELLFRKGIPTAFENVSGHRFMGIITDVTNNGRICIRLENDSEETYEVKQIKMLY